MPHYIKTCPICFKQFHASKLGHTYCSKKCLNKVRTIPAPMLQAMIEKANMCIRVVPVVPKAVRDFVAANKDMVTAIVDNPNRHLTDSLDLLGLSPAEQALLIEQAKKLKEQRRKEELEKEFGDNNNTTKEPTKETLKPVLSDPEMENFKL